MRTFVGAEMYYSLSLPRDKQCKTIHDELTTTYLLPEQTNRINTGMTQNTKRNIIENSPIV